ncbi:hypothetical protein, partial [Pseudomonas syringae group genomosp. 3]|uniref:hypothetical protein n=1 Tax=Pseudomonas syringae group genomosp. 3 TaxID=251701 RepID=UPI004035B77B
SLAWVGKEYSAVVQFVWVGQSDAGQAVFATGGRINPSERRDWPAFQQNEGRNLPEKRKIRPAG